MAQPVDRKLMLEKLPPEWPQDLMPDIQQKVQESGRTVVVLDDDPTGTQTVHDTPVLITWNVEALAAELGRELPCFYILTNSRSLAAPEAIHLNRTIGQNLLAASRQTGRDVAVVSRSDSTLRGHFPGEVEALDGALGDDRHGWLIVPFFLEGGRYTIDNVHWVAEGDDLIPAAQTPYARDEAFGYTQSDLRAWVAEKTGGAVATDAVAAITLADIRTGGPSQVRKRLLGLSNRQVCIVNAASYRDLEVFVLGLLEAEAAGHRFLYRTAASFVRVRAGLQAHPLLDGAALDLPRAGGGLIVVGSYVPKTTAQVNALLTHPGLVALEVDVHSLLDERRAQTLDAITEEVNRRLSRGQTTLVYTSRTYVGAVDGDASLAIGRKVSDGLIAIVQGLRQRPRYLLAKGGITSSDVATRGLGIRRANVAGQILPGVPVWQAGAESRFPGLAYIVFPGNVGDDQALVTTLSRLASPSSG